MAKLDIFPIPAFSDNYIWCLKDNQTSNVILVDPGDAAPVIQQVVRNGLKIEAILITHHHPDHIGGIQNLLEHMETPLIYGPAEESIPHATHSLSGGDQIKLTTGNLSFDIISLPGHTLGHIAYFQTDMESPALFCGDTLFSAGCGRLFEGTPDQMFASLEKLKQLPKDTQVFCTHEYTQSNLAFAAAVEPNNEDLKAYTTRVNDLRHAGKPSLPSTIANELKINPFLRCHINSVIHSTQAHTGQNQLPPGSATFGALRAWKDNF